MQDVDESTEIASALEILDGTRPYLAGVRLAKDVTDVVGPRRFFHAGPPIASEEMIGPMRAAVMGALVLEGEAADLEQAEAIVAAGEVELRSCNDQGATGLATGIISPHVPVVLSRTAAGREAFAPLHEGNGATLRYGAYGSETLANLRWMADVLAPALDAAVAASDPIDLTAIQAEGLRRGDECHNRNAATSAALALALAPALVRTSDTEVAAELLTWLAANNQLFLSFSMIAAKAIADEVHAASAPGIVTTIAANGREVGIRVSGCGDRWFTTEAPLGRPRILDGFRPEDAAPLMGDSFVTEVTGLGAMASSAAPALASFLGTDPADGVAKVAEMRRICAGTSTRYLLPFEGYAGTPIGIDVSRVCATGIAPLVNGGFAHREPGLGMVGAGVVRLPLEPFREAQSALVH